MSCNKDGNCKNIANDYVSKKGSINGSLSSMKSHISSISSALNGLNVPNDYIGSKVVVKITSISSSLSSAEGSVDSVKAGVNGFIDQKKAEHEQHYSDWKAAQDALKLKSKKKEDDDEEDDEDDA